MSNNRERANEIMEQLLAEHVLCHDEETLMTTLYYAGGEDPEPGYRILRENLVPLMLDGHAESQLLARLQVPGLYIHRCPPELRAKNINYWIQEYGDKKILLRYYKENVRALFASRFKPDHDDHLLFPVVLENLQEENIHLGLFHKMPDFSQLWAYFRDTKVVHEGQQYFAGLTVVNSEVGKSAVHIRPVVRGGVAGNAFNFIDRSHEGVTSIRHLTELNYERIAKAIEAAKRVAQVGIHQVLVAGTQMVADPVKEISWLVDASDFLPNRLTSILEEEYEDQQQVSKLKIAHSILTAIKNLPLFDKYLAEQEVGRYLDLFSSTSQRMKDIAEEINVDAFAV